MTRAEGATAWFHSLDTCLYKGRIFHFSTTGGKLTVTEVFLDDWGRFVSVRTDLDSPSLSIACCAIGSRILVMSGNDSNVFGFLLRIDDGELMKTSIQAETLSVSGNISWGRPFFLHSVSDTRVFLYFHEESRIWCGELAAHAIKLRSLTKILSPHMALCSPPVALPSGEFLVAATCQDKNGMHIVSVSRTCALRRVGSVPRGRAFGASALLVRERFLVGFGGTNVFSNCWILDTHTSRRSFAWCDRRPTFEGCWPFLLARGDVLYLLGRKLHSLTIRQLSESIYDKELRGDFCFAIGLSRDLTAYPYASQSRFFREASMWTEIAHIHSYNTVQSQNRILTAFTREGRICVAEIFVFGKQVGQITVDTGVQCAHWRLCCCLLGREILVLSGVEGKAEVSAYLICVDEGWISQNSIHVRKLEVRGEVLWKAVPFLVWMGGSAAWLSFSSSTQTWLCEIEGDLLRAEPSLAFSDGTAPVAAPVRLSDGTVAVATAGAACTTISLLRKKEALGLENFAKVLESQIFGVSLFQAGERLLGMIGGRGSFWLSRADHAQLIDLRSGAVFPLQDCEVPRLQDTWAVPVVREGIFYLLGGCEPHLASYASVRSITQALGDEALSAAFRRWAGVPLLAGQAFSGDLARNSVSPLL